MRVIVAVFDGRCGPCDGPIRAYVDEIVSFDDEWCHADCVEEEGEDVER